MVKLIQPPVMPPITGIPDTSTGGAYGAGTVFELTQSGASWTKTTLYS